MVVRLQPPLLDDIEYTQSVIEQRRNGGNAIYFADQANWWQGRITEYNRERGDPTRIPPSPIPVDHKDKFINLYSSSARDHRHVQEIRDLRNSRGKLLVCPACGEDGTPRTLDHYLPKTSFPEFAIHLKNLVPMCDVCQGIKGEKFLNNNGEKYYFHSYFDPIPEELFLIDIAPPFSAPSGFRLEVSGDAGPLHSLAERHAEGLNLQDRIATYCVEKYSHLLKSTATNRNGAKIEITLLIRAFLINEQQKSSNSWAALFYRSVLANSRLLDYLDRGILPDFYLP